MLKKISMGLIGMVILSANAQTYNLKGVVSNSNGEPIGEATVTAVMLGLSATTDADGKFSFIGTSTRKVHSFLPQTTNVSLKNNVLQFALGTASPMKVQIFNLKGSLLRQETKQNAAAGTYNLNLSNFYQAANVLLVKAAIGNSEETFRCIPLSDGRYTLHRSNIVTTNSNGQRFAADDEALDTLIVSATGYRTKSVAITSLDDQDINITLKANDEKNDPAPSCGCGKEPGAINRSGTYTINTSGKPRTYIVRFPNNYDKANPYRLIFGMHCMGASAQDIAGTNPRSDGAYDFYRLGSLATNAILVAPQGPNSNGTWGGQEDHTFFEDLLTLLKDTLCIDTTRVFSCGFSFGAMYTYSLSTFYQQQLRAVAVYAPANYVIWLPTNKHLPLAYMQTTGMGDNTCPWVQGGSQGGKFCAIGRAEDNGCDDPTTLSEWKNGSGQYVEYDYQGCDEGYPVKIVTFGGQHTAGESWMPQMTWEFFDQF